MRLVLENENDVINFVSENSHDIRLARDLVWHANQVPHVSIIARTSREECFCWWLSCTANASARLDSRV